MEIDNFFDKYGCNGNMSYRIDKAMRAEIPGAQAFYDYLVSREDYHFRHPEDLRAREYVRILRSIVNHMRKLIRLKYHIGEYRDPE